MRQIWILSLVLCLAAVSGCHHCGCCSKRASEMNCPTDIRRAHCWCFGEDALFHCPCGPNEEYYGHQATCWREWPTGAEQWRNAYCPPPMGSRMPFQEEMWYSPAGEDAAVRPGPEPANPPINDATMPNRQQFPETTPGMMDDGRQPMPSHPAVERGYTGLPQQVPEWQGQPARRTQHLQIRDGDQLLMPEMRQRPLGSDSRRSAFKVQQPPIMDAQPIQWSGIR